MAYSSGAEMMFGTAKKPVTTKRGITIGGGYVHPEVVTHPRPGSEKTLKTLLREYERANGDALERMVIVGHPTLQIENEHVFQMTHNPKWGGEIAAQTAMQMDDYLEKYGLKASYRSTIADLRKPDMVNIRESDYTMEVLESFKECSKYADIVSIESMGGKEIFDHAIIRNDIAGIIFGIGVLGAIDTEWMWTQIVEIATKNGCIPGGDTNCSEANTAMFMAGGMTSKDVPHVFAALARAVAASRTMTAYECGATGPTKDCAYEDPIIKAMCGVPISTEGKTSACAHSDLAGNLIMAVCDLWSNEAVEYHDMFGATTTSVFAEILGYDVAMLNTAIELGYQEQMKEILVNSDMYRDSHSLIVAPDNAWEVGNVIVSNRGTSNYASARAGAMKAGEIILNDPKMKLTELEKTSLNGAMKDMEALPDNEGDFIDMCLRKYKDVKGFRPDSYGLPINGKSKIRQATELKSEKPDSSPNFYFELKGDGVRDNSVLCGAEANLVFNYGIVPYDNVIAKVYGEQLPKDDADLGIAIIAKGFIFRDEIWYRTAIFRNGKILEPVVFKLKAADKPEEDSGFYISFDLRGYIIYQFHLSIKLVNKIEQPVSQPCWRPLEIDLEKIIAEREYAKKVMKINKL